MEIDLLKAQVLLSLKALDHALQVSNGGTVNVRDWMFVMRMRIKFKKRFYVDALRGLNHVKEVG